MNKSILNKQSLTLLFILGTVVLISVSFLTYLNIQDQNNDHDFITETFQRTALMDNIYSVVNESETARRGYFLTNDKQFMTDIGNNKILADSLLKQLRSNSLDNANQLANAETLKPLVNERFQLFFDGMEVQDQKGTNLKFHKNIFDKGKIINIDIKNLLGRMKKEEYKNLDRKKELTESSSQFTYYTFLAGIGASLIIFIIAFVSLIKKASHTFAMINQKLYSKVNELEKMEGNLKSAAEQYRRLFEQAHDAIVIFSPEDEKVIEVNRRACDLYGFSREEFIGLSLRSIWKNIPQDEDNIRHTVEKGYYHNFQSVHSRKDMNEMLMEINASVFNYRGKNVILSINRDITDRILMVPV